MCKQKACALLAMIMIIALLLCGCGSVDTDSVLNATADLSVDISVPYATATPLPDYLNVPDPIIIDSNGGVTVNDSSLLFNSYNRADEYETSQYNTLSLGNTGFAVQTLQTRLLELGYFESEVSGVFDAATEKAVRRFEQTYGIMQTGIATPNFQARLFSSSAPTFGSEAYDTAVVSQYSTLQRGAVGSSVYALQHRLKELGYPISNLTGAYDEETENAIKLFYEAYGLTPQTIAYITLQKELYSDTARPYHAGGVDPAATQSAGNTGNSLQSGNVGTVVMQIQSRLAELGYMSGPATGIFDSETESAVRLFEEACGQEPTGTLSGTLHNILNSNDAPRYGSSYSKSAQLYTDLSQGSEGEAVTSLQDRLIELGFATGSSNGVYNDQTANALKLFQRCNGIEETGIATAFVQSKLYAENAISYQDAKNGVRPQVQNNASEEKEILDFQDIAPEATVNEPEITTLTLNDTGDAVTRIQERLNELGYTCDNSGVYDESTVNAMRSFQSNVGVSQTGNASPEMQEYIYTKAAPKSTIRLYKSTQDYVTLQEGDTGEAVKRLQRKLWELGYLLTENVSDNVGVYHSATKLAVASAQLAMGYETANGIASAEFQCFVLSEYGDLIKK